MAAASPSPFHQLAAAAGVQREWRDVEGRDRVVADDALIAILEALGYQAGSDRRIAASLRRIAAGKANLPPLLVTEVGLPTPVPLGDQQAELTDTNGQSRPIAIVGGALAAIDQPGYYDLACGGIVRKLAVAPSRCPLPARRMWGTSLQIPALIGTRARPFGDFGELAETVTALGQVGCDAVAINPVHALFPGIGTDFSPYSPSSRTFLNIAMGDPALLGLPALAGGQAGQMIDWPAAMPQRLAALQASFAELSEGQREAVRTASAAEGHGLYRHALHDALFCHFRALGKADWRSWPAAYRRPDSAAVQRFAATNSSTIDFHLYAQWLAREGLATAQRRARDAGMAIGLIADLAVGVHPGGSDCWAMPDAMLAGLTIGAPPDPLGPLGQNWSITGFSPQGLRDTGYAGWIAMIRSALRSAGGLRIDHAFGLSRLWVIPDGGECSQGAYLTYPFLDLVRLATLEAHLASALIIAEDLGTAPSGFTSAVSARDMLGMRVLWFERAADHGFIGAHDYPANCVALTGTHDTPTVAGWWRGRDLDWAARLGRLPDDVDRQQAEAIRDWDRGLLWSTIGTHQRPAPDDPDQVVLAALDHVAKSPALLAIAPVEDLLGEAEQQNLPGTTSEHPNWRRRLPAPTSDLLKEPQVTLRLEKLSNRN
jgi:4-alpha-glucanotransferase